MRSVELAALVTVLGQWAGRGPAYLDLARALRGAVLDGRLPLAAQLPGERALAAALSLSRTTVTAAYTQLRDEGFLVSRQGARSVTGLPAGTPTLAEPLPYAPASGDVLDLAYATLPAPAGVIHRAYAAALQALPTQLPTHGYAPLGLPALRERVAARYTARGLSTRAEEVLITFGAQHALSLVLRALALPGDRVLVDQPSYPNALDALRHAALRPVPVALTAQGWDLAGLRAALRQTAPRLAYLIPDFHNPTGLLMPEDERAGLLHAAARTRTALVIDETLADLALDPPPPPPFAAQEPRAEVIHLGSLSKSCWGGLRLGWLRAPASLTARLVAARSSLDLGTPILEQLAALYLLDVEAPVLEARRAQLRRQRARLVAALSAQLPAWRFAVPPGGLSLWVNLPGPYSAALAASAEGFGVRVASGNRFGVDGLLDRHLRLPFTLPEADLERAVTRLALAEGALGAAPRRTPSEATLI